MNIKEKIIQEKLINIHNIRKLNNGYLIIEWFIEPNWYTNYQIGELVIHPIISKDGIVFKTIDDEMMPKKYKEYIYSKLITILLNNKKAL